MTLDYSLGNLYWCFKLDCPYSSNNLFYPKLVAQNKARDTAGPLSHGISTSSLQSSRRWIKCSGNNPMIAACRRLTRVTVQSHSYKTLHLNGVESRRLLQKL